MGRHVSDAGLTFDASGYPYVPDLSLWIAGSFQEGGPIRLDLLGRVWQVTLPPKLFGLLAVLAQKAKEDDVAGMDTWIPRGFLPAKHIVLRMRDGGNEPDPDYIARYVFRTRRLLDEHLGTGSGDRVLEYRKGLGYRLAVAPDRISLVIMKDT